MVDLIREAIDVTNMPVLTRGSCRQPLSGTLEVLSKAMTFSSKCFQDARIYVGARETIGYHQKSHLASPN